MLLPASRCSASSSATSTSRLCSRQTASSARPTSFCTSSSSSSFYSTCSWLSSTTPTRKSRPTFPRRKANSRCPITWNRYDLYKRFSCFCEPRIRQRLLLCDFNRHTSPKMLRLSLSSHKDPLNMRSFEDCGNFTGWMYFLCCVLTWRINFVLFCFCPPSLIVNALK